MRKRGNRATTRAVKAPRKSASKSASAIVKPPSRTPEDEALVAATVERRRQRPLPGFLDDGEMTKPDSEDHRLWTAKLQRAMGAESVSVALRQLAQLSKVHGARVPDTGGSFNINADIGAVAGIGPRDQLESLLAVQMVALHNFGMRSLAQAALPEQTVEGQVVCANRAIRLLRAYREHVETLMRYRGKGEQRVTVEHVHVHQGGQAIVGVGAVQVPARSAGGGGSEDEK